MRISFFATVSAALLGLFLASPVFAQQKTVKACQLEWRANKADNQAKGITEKAYVADCRAGTNAAQPTNTPTTAAPPAKIKPNSRLSAVADRRAAKQGNDTGLANDAAAAVRPRRQQYGHAGAARPPMEKFARNVEARIGSV